MPKSVEEALRLATQQEAVETAQKRLCKQRTQELIDGDFNEIAAAVKPEIIYRHHLWLNVERKI